MKKTSFLTAGGTLALALCLGATLASAAPCALIESVKHFSLGLTIEPDSSEAVVRGMRSLIASPLSARWDDYEAASAWETNARGILRAAGLPVKIGD